MNDSKKNARIDELKKRLVSGFFWFWIRQYRISYLIVFWIIVLGSISLINIPKESNPAINLWMITIATVDVWVNPTDIDALITDKIYKEIKDIEWIDKIQSSSSLWMSTIILTLKTDANSKDVTNEVRNNVNRVVLPTDAKTPIITEVNTNTKMAFSVYIYAKNPVISKTLLLSKAQAIKDKVEKVAWVESVKISGISLDNSPVSLGWGSTSDYDLELVVPEEKIHATWLSLSTIASDIQAWNKDVPVGNFWVGERNYDFRIEWKSSEILPFLDIPLVLPDNSVIRLWDIVTIERVYKDKSIANIGFSDGKLPYNVVWLSINKTAWAAIFTVSALAKAEIEKQFSTSGFSEYGFVYGNDLADTITDDYKELAKEALITLTLVFIAMYLFVWFKDSLFACLTLPLAFFSTFILLSSFGFSLNFLTNFSLILSFWIAVDTIIVIVQASSAKMRVWYNPDTAILLALKEYARPIISWVMTTIVVFIPMMTLPGMMGKFLAYIPITIFGVLATWLVLALTVNSALYLLFVKWQNTFVENETILEYAEEEEKEILAYEREWKQEIKVGIPLRIRVIHACTEWYKETLRWFLENTFLRRLSIIVPFILLILSFIYLAPAVGLELFPWDDQWIISFTVEWANGLRTEEMAKKIEWIESVFRWVDEMKYYTLSINNNVATIVVQLLKKQERDAKNMRNAYDLEKLFLGGLAKYENAWLKVVSQVAKNWPPWSKAVWLKLIAQKPEELPTLISTAKVFEKYLKTIKWTKNAGVSSQDTPGQFVFTLNKSALSFYNISPLIIYGQIAQMLNGIPVWTIEDNGTDMDIVLRQSNFREKINPEDIMSTLFTVWPNTYQLWNFVEYKAVNAIASVNREAGKVQIVVDADLEPWVDSLTTQNAFWKFAESYSFPAGISYEVWGENQANQELIVAVLSAFFIAILVIFAILILQFDSFSQPMIVLYSVIMSLPFVMVGLLLTDNKFSITFWIGFIAFTGIAVNHGIILLDAINQNLKKWMEWFTALIEAGSSRLEPMTLTTVTTALGILPIALHDKLWSGMGFTIIFGIISASTLTLFVVKWIYYEVYIAPKVRRAVREKRRVKI